MHHLCRPVMRSLVGTLSGAALLFFCRDEAHADDNEWHLGIAAGWSVTEATDAKAQHGIGHVVSARYGITDAIEVDFNLLVSGFPRPRRMIYGTSVGLSYVFDVSRWVVWFGGTVGVSDVWRVECPPPYAACTHLIRPTVSIPVGFEYRVKKNIPIGIRFEYQFLFALPPESYVVGEPSSQIFLGAYAGFVP